VNEEEKKQRPKTKYVEFFQDINLDYDQKTLAGFVVGFVAIVLSIVCVIYGLAHQVQSTSLIGTIIVGLFGLCASLLSITLLTKERTNMNVNGDNNHE